MCWPEFLKPSSFDIRDQVTLSPRSCWVCYRTSNFILGLLKPETLFLWNCDQEVSPDICQVGPGDGSALGQNSSFEGRDFCVLGKHQRTLTESCWGQRSRNPECLGVKMFIDFIIGRGPCIPGSRPGPRGGERQHATEPRPHTMALCPCTLPGRKSDIEVSSSLQAAGRLLLASSTRCWLQVALGPRRCSHSCLLWLCLSAPVPRGSSRTLAFGFKAQCNHPG